MSNVLETFVNRATAKKIPLPEEIEQFGADGEEAVYRLLCEHFDCVVRNAVVPHKSLYLEKDFFVSVRGVPFVLEIKNWKGEIGIDGDKFYQVKENGVRKLQKSPVGTTNQFLRCMKAFYGIDRPIYGVVVFVEPNCTLSLPEELDGIALLPVHKLVPYLRAKARLDEKTDKKPPIEVSRLLRCTRFYSADSEFTKGMLVDGKLECTRDDGALVRLDTTRLTYVSVEPQPLRLRDKLYVSFDDGTSGIFYNRDALLTVACLDGSFCKLALNRIRHIVF